MKNVFFKDLLRDAMSRAELTPPALAKRLRVTRQTVYKWLDGQLPSHRHSQAINELLGIPAYPVSNVLQHVKTGRTIPLIEGDIANAGNGAVSIHNDTISRTQEYLDVDFPVSEGTVALRIRGDSMEPEFFDGEIVIVDPEMAPQNGDYVIAEIGDPEHAWTFKQFRHRGHHGGMNVFDLVPINPQYKTITVGPDVAGRVVGTMVEHRRRPYLRRRR